MGGISKKVSWEIAKKIFLPVLLFLVFIGSYIFYKSTLAAYIPAPLRQSLKKHIIAVLIIIIAFICQRIVGAVSIWYGENIASKTETHLDDELIPLIRRTLKVLIWVLALLVILPFYGVNISALITTLGVSSLAIALAAQDTIANIISGFMIMVDRPFRRGDKIKLPSGEEVEVLEIGVRRSKFLSQDKAIIIVPNTDMSKSKIVNYTYGQERLKNES
jgi:small-conductance mechanosensitive channel